MKIDDYKCPKCGTEKLDELVRTGQEVKCPKCDTLMKRKISAPNLGGMDKLGRSGNH